ncbi:Inactive histone-lysine N-methyltransferase 2E [Araneus ventricosus]|uniref:Inactive histone-lysine N-methyltransferase 2E n=1 Tax=Araneus ventricosus TaxID=182803 RepID=A0A4Y2AXR0_ARAVE|nr:Inactive histone-lysine N-methyltransferase 2E [Araneus ventricosus]
MSIIIQFNSSPFIQSAGAVPSNAQCRSKTSVKLEMVPGIEQSELPGMTDDESSIVDIATSNSVFATTLKDVRSSQCCFGLPYQDHNYGAPPPPTPPSYSPCPSPAVDVAIPDDDTNLSIISTTTTTEEAQEESITRCICGFEHDDEYMICCDHCLVWQHVDCMGLDRNNIPETYLCEKCEPRKLDRHKAKLLQARKKVALTKLPATKQESCANNLIFGKNYKKKTLLQTPEEWHKTDYQVMPPVSLVQRFYCTSDSDEDNKNTERRPKTRSKRRKRDEEKSELSTRRSKSFSKHGKERMDAKRSKLRRNKNKESTSTADEEAQDAWQYSTEWCEENFEAAVTNQYTSEVQQLACMINPLGFEKQFFEQLHNKQCHVLDDGKRKQLVCLYDLPRNQPVIEYKGKFLLASQFHDIHPLYNKRLYPYVLFYKLDETEICVDASIYGNDARFVRKSCKPNAEIRHMVYNGNLHLYLQSTKVIFSEDEVTVPLTFNDCDSIKEIECACGSDECLLKPKKKNGSIEIIHEKRRRSRRTTVSADDESSQSLVIAAQTEKIKTSQAKNPTSDVQVAAKSQVLPIESNDQVVDLKLAPSDHETEEHTIESKKKMTREERKLAQIMQTFYKMEKAEKRKQQKEALERQKIHPKAEEPVEKNEPVAAVPKEEEKTSSASAVEEQCEEEVKVESKAPLTTSKPKKGKRRRGSGTPSRRRTRTNSGGSDILRLVQEELPKASEEPPTVPVTTVPVPTSAVAVNETPVQPDCAPNNNPPVVLDAIEPPPVILSPKPSLMKRKTSLMNVWLLSELTETKVNLPTPKQQNSTPTCYVRCTKDTPHSGGISAAHLRRSNSSGLVRTAEGHYNGSQDQGFTKKRWLRQAMSDSGSCEEQQLKMDPGSLEHLDSVCLSPICHGDADSPGTVIDADVLTPPLKKRRLLRESVESLPYPHSPSIENCLDDTDATTSSSLLNDSHADTMEQHSLSATNDDFVGLSPIKEKHVADTNTLKMEEHLNEDIKEEVVNCDIMSSSEEKNSKDQLHFDKNKLCETSESTIQNNCDVNGDVSDIKTHASFKKDYIKTISSLNTGLTLIKESVKSENHPQPTATEESASSESRTDVPSIKTAKQSFIKVEDAEDPIKDLPIQMQLQNSISVNASQSVNNTSPVKSKCTSSTRNNPASETIQHSPSKEIQKSETNTTKSSMQDKIGGISPCKASSLEVSTNINPCETSAVNKDEDDSTNDRPSDLNVTPEKVCNVTSSCSDIASSSVGSAQSNDSASDITDVNTQARCTPSEESSPVKACGASATQKRKVSLSEYRMRVRENTNRSRSNSESEKKPSDISVNSSLVKTEVLPAKLTLAPLPLFDSSDSSVNLANKQGAVKKKKESACEDNQDVSEHRENLNERLKREFGFDFSEGSSLMLPKSKCNNQTSSNPSVSKLPVCAQPPPPPPPPPPPRPVRCPQASELRAVSTAMPSQFGYVHPSFPRPPYIVPPRVPGAPYIATQPTMVAPIMPPVPPNPTVRPPLLPTTHSFAPSMPPAILRTPTRHEYAPVNAQRFTTMVPQPPMNHKAYPHVYPSGLYK